MTLIAGIRGVNKSYIAADSRQSYVNNGVIISSDDGVKKWVNHGPFSLTAVAGDAQLAAFITRRLVEMLGVNPTYPDVRRAFDSELIRLATEYNQETGRYCSCVIMLAGFDANKMDEFDAGRLGAVLGAGVKAKGEGVTVNQHIDSEIIKSMSYAMTMADIFRRELRIGSKVKLNRPKSELTGYRINVNSDGVDIDVDEADNFEALFYGADSAFNRITLPDEIISELYFRDITGHTEESIIKADTMQLFVFIKTIIEERSYENVGGGIFPVMMTPTGGSYYAGGITKKSTITGVEEQVRDSEVIDGKICYKDVSGEMKQYKSLLDIADESGFTVL